MYVLIILFIILLLMSYIYIYIYITTTIIIIDSSCSSNNNAKNDMCVYCLRRARRRKIRGPPAARAGRSYIDVYIYIYIYIYDINMYIYIYIYIYIYMGVPICREVVLQEIRGPPAARAGRSSSRRAPWRPFRGGG